MNTGQFPKRHMVIAIASIVAVAVLIVVIYGSNVTPEEPALTAASAMKVMKAAHDYTYALRLAKKPVPPTLPLTNLVALKYLTEQDVAAFKGLDATLTLLVTNDAPNPVLLRVREPDGAETVVLADGTTRQLPFGRQ